MPILIIVDEPDDWPLEIPGATIASARTYLTDPKFAVNHSAGQTVHSMDRSARVFNLCKSYHYQSSGYYVSLLAEARGHKPMPRVGPIEDLQSQNLVRHLTQDLSVLIQRLLRHWQGTISNSVSISAALWNDANFTQNRCYVIRKILVYIPDFNYQIIND